MKISGYANPLSTLDSGTGVYHFQAGQPGASAEETAQAALATVLGVPADELDHVRTEDVIWNDSGLGCMQHGYAYASVRTPGQQVHFEHDGETQKPVNTPSDGRYAVYCTGGPQR